MPMNWKMWGERGDWVEAGATSAEEEPPSLAPSRDDTRFPNQPRRRRRRIPQFVKEHPWRAGFTLLFAFSLISNLFADEQRTPPSQPVSLESQVVVDQQLDAYLGQVEDLCQRHFGDVRAEPDLPIGLIYKRETAYTRGLAAVPVPPTAVNMRLRLLEARRGLDDIVYRTYQRMTSSEHPRRVYWRFVPEIKLRSGLVHQVTNSFGIRCAQRR